MADGYTGPLAFAYIYRQKYTFRRRRYKGSVDAAGYCGSGLMLVWRRYSRHHLPICRDGCDVSPSNRSGRDMSPPQYALPPRADRYTFKLII